MNFRIASWVFVIEGLFYKQPLLHFGLVVSIIDFVSRRFNQYFAVWICRGVSMLCSESCLSGNVTDQSVTPAWGCGIQYLDIVERIY